MITGESVDTNPQTRAPLPPEPPTPKGGRASWLRLLLAPLLALSVVAHLALLFIPLPSRPVAEVEEEATAEEFVDLLSISSIATPEPELEPDIPATPPPEATPPPVAAVAPTAPTQPIVPEVFASTPISEAAPTEATPPAEANFNPPPEQPETSAPPEEVVALASRLARGQGSDFDITEASFPHDAYDTRGGIGEWSAQEQGCFFTQVSNTRSETKPNIISLRYWGRNIGLIQQEDLPNNFPAPEYQVTNLGGYCNRPLFQVSRGSGVTLFVSIVGIGVGNPQSTGLVIFWSSDPRLG